MEKWPQRFPDPESVTQGKAAKLVALSQNAGFKWKHGKLPERKHLAELAVKLDVCVEWLETGRGPKFCLPTESVVLAEIMKVATRLDELQQMSVLDFAQYTERGEKRRTHSR